MVPAVSALLGALVGALPQGMILLEQTPDEVGGVLVGG